MIYSQALRVTGSEESLVEELVTQRTRETGKNRKRRVFMRK